MKKIGISIPWNYLSGNIVTTDAEVLEQNFGSAPEFLNFLKDLEVTYVELRHRKKDMSQTDMDSVFQLLIDSEFKITIHGDNPLPGNTWTINEVFPWLDSFKRINPNENNTLMITLHPFTGAEPVDDYRAQTIEFIKRLDDMITSHNLPIKLALENQRSKKVNDPAKSFKGVEGMWKEINRTNAGICWDMGHCYSNHLLDNTLYPVYPHPEFSTATIHTHIHDLGPDGRTHWIFKENRVPIADFIRQLKAVGYKGVYNLELSFDRFASEKDHPKLIKDTIIKLGKMI